MFIAHKLKKGNICEYLLYMWQIEDLIRAFKLDIDAINMQIIAPYPATDAERKSLYEWYESLIEMMRHENIQQNGHLQLNNNILSELNEFHTLMLKSGNEAGYNAKFYHIVPLITQLRNQQLNSPISDIEICFNFQYAIMLLRMKKTEITPETLQAQSEISKFMVLLNKYFQLHKTGEFSFDED
ncbi:MAG: DUF4924 family protein [Paludibacter sp.]|nr:DUF4924 family protein [Paludibacter sp.]